LSSQSKPVDLATAANKSSDYIAGRPKSGNLPAGEAALKIRCYHRVSALHVAGT